MANSREHRALRRSYRVFKKEVDPDTIVTVLYSELLLTKEEKGKATQKTLTPEQQLDSVFECLERRVSVDSSVFHKLVQVLLAEPALKAVGKKMQAHYDEEQPQNIPLVMNITTSPQTPETYVQLPAPSSTSTRQPRPPPSAHPEQHTYHPPSKVSPPEPTQPQTLTGPHGTAVTQPHPERIESMVPSTNSSTSQASSDTAMTESPSSSCTLAPADPVILMSPGVSYNSVPSMGEVQAKIHELEQKFNALKNSTREVLESRKIDVKKVVEWLTNLPADDMPEHKVFLEDHIRALLQAESHLELFLRMNLNYLAYQLLEHIIKEISVKEVKREMEEYKSHLQQFMWNTPLEVFCRAQKKRAVNLPPGFKELVIKFPWPQNVTLGAVEEFRQQYAYHYNLRECAMMLITIHLGSVTVVWGIPESIVQHLMEEVAEDVLSKYLVTRVEIGGVCVYDQMPAPIGSATDCPPKKSAALHPVATSADQEYVLVNPSKEFICPVTFRVLLDPHQTQCCGQEVSAEVAIKLQREGRACPLCQKEHFTSYPDKRFCRQVREQLVYCLNYKRGCEWVGELGNYVDSHENTCPSKNSPITRDMVQLSQTLSTGVPTTKVSTHKEHTAEVDTIDLSDLKIGEKRLGGGRSGNVYEGTWKKNGVMNVAVKVKLSSDTKAVPSEIQVWITFPSHPNIIKLFGVAYAKFNIFIVSELAVNGSLFRYLHKEKHTPSVDQSLAWASDVAHGMKHLHNHDIVHRDLKSANVLLTSKWVAKLCDFGCARKLTHTITTEQVGTIRWMSPEIMRSVSARINKKCDMFSYGMVLFELFAYEIPYAELEDDIKVMLSVTSGIRPPIPPTLPSYLHDLLRGCWEEDPNLRPTFDEILHKSMLNKAK